MIDSHGTWPPKNWTEYSEYAVGSHSNYRPGVMFKSVPDSPSHPVCLCVICCRWVQNTALHIAVQKYSGRLAMKEKLCCFLFYYTFITSGPWSFTEKQTFLAFLSADLTRSLKHCTLFCYVSYPACSQS